MTNADLKSKLTKSVDFLKSEFSQIRTGRANPSLIEDVTIEAYGSKMAIKELGSISLADSQTIVITPWDKSLLGAIRTAIRDSELKLNPVELGGILRVPIPPLTEERRKELTKLVSQKAEDCKQSLRNIRQEAMKDIDKEFEEKKVSEDEKFTKRDQVEDLVKTHVEEVEALAQTKNKEIMTV